MTGMEHAIKKAADVIASALHDQADADLFGWYTDTDDLSDSVLDGRYSLIAVARALAESGLLAPAPLTEEWAAIDDDGDVRMRYGADSHSPHREFGTSWTYSRWASDWKRWEGD